MQSLERWKLVRLDSIGSKRSFQRRSSSKGSRCNSEKSARFSAERQAIRRNELRKRLLVVAGESSVLAGWAASDMGDSVTARNFYDTAAKAAEEAKDPEITACALAYRSYIPSAKGANGRARVLLAEALEVLPRNSSPGTLAWIAARHAEESAHLGDSAQALTSWERAEEAYSVADTDDDRVWTRFLDQNRFDSYRISTLAKIGRLDEAQEVASTLLARLDHPDRKKAAIIFEDMATAYLARGAVNEASKLAKSGLAVLRETEFTMWLPRYEVIAQALRQPEQAASGTGIPRRVRYDEASVRVSALIQSRYSRLPQEISVAVISGVS